MSCFIRTLRTIHWIMNKLCPKEIKHIEVPLHKLPWFWVGAEVGDTLVSITHLVNESVNPSSIVTPLYLSELSGYPNTVVWKYMDRVTLEEKEIPSEGFVIEEYVTS